MANFKETSNAKKGGLFVGKSHAEGGIPAIVTDTGQPIEVEGGEAIINKKATALHWKELSKINQSAGNGVPIPPPDEADKILEKYDNGGKITNKEKKVVYDKWKKLVNMTYTELSRYYHSKDGKTSGLTKDEADKQGISSGRESAEWILKMKKTSYKNWTDEMWKWANKQISFISRMSGVQGDLVDEKGKKTPKYKALLIWGNNPKKKNAPQFSGGGSTSSADAIKGLKALLPFADETEKQDILTQIEILENPVKDDKKDYQPNKEYIDYLVDFAMVDAVELKRLNNFFQANGVSKIGLLPEEIKNNPEYQKLKSDWEKAKKKPYPKYKYPKNRDRVQESKDRQIAKAIVDDILAEIVPTPSKIVKNKPASKVVLTKENIGIDRTKIPMNDVSKKVFLGTITASNGDELKIYAEEINLSEYRTNWEGSRELREKFVRKIYAQNSKAEVIMTFFVGEERITIYHLESSSSEYYHKLAKTNLPKDPEKRKQIKNWLSKGSQKLGYGTDLVKMLISEAKKSGKEKIIAHDVVAFQSAKFWEKLGFTDYEYADADMVLELKKYSLGGLTSSHDAIKGLKALLPFVEDDEREEILAQIEALTSPAKQSQNEETNDVYPENVDIVAVDKSIKELTKNYIHEIDEILGVSEMDDKRKAILKWIKEPKNNVRVVIAFSGGKDSVAMVLRCIYEFKIDKSQIELWHHEVDGAGENLFDWQCTPSYCQAFADAMGVPILFSYSGGGILREMYRTNEYRQPMYFQNEAGGEYIKTEPRQLDKDKLTRRMFPAVASDLQTRWCSSVAKIEVMSKAINRLPRFQNGNFVVMTGERRAESKNRAKYHEIEKYKTSETRQSLTWRCVIDLSDEDVWALYEKYKIQAHPCYELGWGRCSCQLCIFSTKNIWASINEISPEKIKRIMEIEKDLGHSLYNEFEKIPFDPPSYFKTGNNIGEERFRNGRKLDNIVDAKVSRGKSFIPKEALERWGKEAISTFVSPIFVKEWKRPFGANSKEQSGAN